MAKKKTMTTDTLTEAVGVFSELMQTVRRTAWFYFWLSKEFIGPEVEIRLCKEYETLYVISRTDSQTRLHISYEGRAASISYWKNFKELSGLVERHAQLAHHDDEDYGLNDESALEFMVITIKELMM